MSYTPKGVPRAAILALDEHGAQFTTDLAGIIQKSVKDLRTALMPASAHGLVRFEPRKRPGGRGVPAVLWYLTPAGAKLAERLAAEQGAEA